MITVFDVETTTTNHGNAFTKCNELVSYSYKCGEDAVVFCYYTQPDFIGRLREIFEGASLVVGLNLKFDLHWASRMGVKVPEGTRIWDCQLAEFILSGQTVSFASMNSLCEKYDIPVKEDAVAGYWAQGIDTKGIPKEILEEYGNGDISRTYQIYQHQLKDSRMTPEIRRLILLDGADLLVLQEMEENGLVYDSEKSRENAAKLQVELDGINEQLKDISNGIHINWDSGDHLSCFLYGGTYKVDHYVPTTMVYKSGPRKGTEYTQQRFDRTDTITCQGFFRPLPRSEVKKSTPENPLYQVSEPVLLQLKATSKAQRTIIELLLRRSALEKVINTYFVALPALVDKMEWGNIIHGQYNQVVARTGRLSSSKPNMQNTPPEVDEMFVSRYE